MPEKNPKVKLGLKNLALLPSCFDYIFVHLTLIGTTVHNLSTRVTKGIAALEKIIR